MTTSLHERLGQERRFHDDQARQRARDGVTLQFRDQDYLDHETWIRPALARLGPLTGRQVLDLGCGHGMAAVVLARAGAQVTAIDVSTGYLQEARARARANRVTVNFVAAAGEELPFAAASFDVVWGNAILHHLDVPRAALEMRRVLRPGGVAVFCEPWGGNPLLDWARCWLPYPGKARTVDERPLSPSDIDVLRVVFPHLEIRGFQLFTMVRRVVRWSPLLGALERLDTLVLRQWPSWQRWCRYVVLALPKEGAAGPHWNAGAGGASSPVARQSPLSFQVR